MSRGVVFDIDDTLYLERDYVRSGFESIATLLAAENRSLRERYFTHLWTDFENGTRGNSFDRLLKSYPELSNQFTPKDLVTAYRNHEPILSMIPGMHELLDELREQKVRLGAISDGPHACQAAKSRALRLSERMDAILLTDCWGREFWKPHPRSFQQIQTSWESTPDRLTYIADNPVKDFFGPKKLGWRTIRLRIPGQLHFSVEAISPEYEADFECRSIGELIELIRNPQRMKMTGR